MSEQFSIITILIKFLALLAGGIVCLALSDDIDNQGRVQLSLMFVIKLLASIMIGLFAGEFLIDYLDWELKLGIFAQGFILMTFSAFGMLFYGLLYRTIQITLKDKTLSEIIDEVKRALSAIIR